MPGWDVEVIPAGTPGMEVSSPCMHGAVRTKGENLPTQTGSLPLQRPSSMQTRLRSPSS